MPYVDIVHDREEYLGREATLAGDFGQKYKESDQDHDYREKVAHFLAELEALEGKERPDGLYDIQYSVD